MKPLRLELAHIGPFNRPINIDFTQLDDIFLIHGKTGSGKTSIFDAICYALYGSLPGTRKSQIKNLKSDFSPPEARPMVMLDFSLGNKQYRVERVPGHERPSKRGAGTTWNEDEAILFEELQGQRIGLAGKKSEVDAMLQQLIGLSVEEFSKVVLLPQGEFSEFLRQSSTDRLKVLQKLFPLEQAARIKDLANERAGQLIGELSEVERRLDDLQGPDNSVQGMQASQAEGEKQLQKMTDSLKALKEKLSTDENLLNEHREKIKKRDLAQEALLLGQKNLEQEREKKPEIDALHSALQIGRRAQPLLHVQEKQQTAQESLDLAHAQLASSNAELNLAQAQLQEAELAATKKEALQSELGSYQRREGELESLLKEEAAQGNKLAEFAKAKHRLEELQEKLSRLSLSEEAYQNELQGLRGSQEEYDTTRRTLEQERQNRDTLDEILRWLEVYIPKVEELKECKQRGTAYKKEAEQKESIATTKNQEYQLLREQVEAQRKQELTAELAAQLEKGQACPVCGSCQHPLPASTIDRGAPVYQEDLRMLEEAVQNANSELSTATAKLQATREEYRRIETAKDRQLALAPDIEVDLQAINLKEYQKQLREEKAQTIQKLNDAVDAEKNARSNSKRYNELLNSINNCTSERQQLLAEQLPLSNLYTELKAELSALHTKKNALLARFAEEQWDIQIDASTASEELLQLLRQRRQLVEKNLANIDSALVSAKENMAAERQNNQSRSEQLKSAQKALQEAQTAFADGLQTAGFKDMAELETALEVLHKEQEIEEQINEHQRALAGLSSLVSERQQACELAEQELAQLLAKNEILHDREKAEQTSLALKSEIQETENAREQLRDRLKAVEQHLHEIQQTQKRRAELSQAAKTHEMLKRDLTGKNPNKRAFEAWLLSIYLAEITACATKRLERMSDGRYRLVLDNTQGGRGLGGLDLAVWDAFTGKQRPCATLSGGESFMASISLALGLADSIQNRSGGIRLDALFIDEGFGSLDEESLDMALNILDEIRDHRMVGLISHVSEMHSRFPSRIKVEKTSAGSKIKMILP